MASSRTRSPLRVALASFIGTAVEFYDFLIYGTAAALVFPTVFFPDSSPFVGALLAFATFGVGFFARPIGGVVFGHFGDRVGRKKMLVISLMGMGAATVLMGLLPPYAAIGIAAPILLALLRLVQGFCVGGEWGGAVLMAVEHAPAGRRGFYGAFPQMGAPAGVALATLVFLIVAALPDADFLAWGWRIPFLFSAVLVIIGLVIRLTVDESPEFARVRDLKQRVRIPAIEAFRSHGKQILLVAGIYLSQGVFAYICASYFVQYGTSQAGLDRQGALLAVFIAALVAVALYAVFGALSDVWGRKTTYMLGAVAMAVTIGPALVMIDSGQLLLFGAALVLVFGLAMAPSGGAAGSLISLLFSAEVRYSGASIGYTISQILGAAFAPLIAVALFEASGSLIPLFIYLAGVSLISIVSLVLAGGPWGRKEAQAQNEHTMLAKSE